MHLKIATFTFLGFIFLGIGAVGVFLPILPTASFVLVSETCFSGAPKIKARIMKISFFKEHTENYRLRGGLSKTTLLSRMPSSASSCLHLHRYFNKFLCLQWHIGGMNIKCQKESLIF